MADTTNLNSTIDFNDEFYIHHGDTSNIFMLASQRLNGDNYGEWKRAAEIFLSAKNKLGFVTGTCTKPEVNSSQFNNWDRCNNLVITWILHSVEPDIRRSILYLQTATEVWSDLKERYAQSNIPRKFQVHKQISSISQGNDYVASYYTQLKTGWDEYMSLVSLPSCTCGSSTTFLAILQEQQGNTQGTLFGIAPNGRRSKFFYTNCNVWGHSLDRCFKVNPTNRDRMKKSVNCAHDGNNVPLSSSEQPPMATSFTQEQVNQLISLLSAHHLEPSSQSPNMSSAFMAGAFKETSSGPW